ncbi:MAG: ATP-binding protein [Methanomassiliicoccales archaeon]|nr:MAG: ATP-binding protein [Methanomassiliicoccales archaeon]
MVDTIVEQKILRLLSEQNPWWVTKEVPEYLAKPFRRRDFYIYRDKLEEADITAIVGPRQIGKTTVMYQLIQYLVHETGVDPKRIMYNSFDYPYLTTLTETPINDLLDVFSSQILREPTQELEDKVYVFFDEICKLEEWSRVLKGWFDLKYPLKFMISDSSSSDILRGSSESLVGRINPNIMLSLKFVDYLNYFEGREEINKVNWDLRNSLQLAIDDDDIDILFKELKLAFSKLVHVEKTIQLHLQQYLLKDGYPELLDNDNLASCRQKLRDYLTLTIYKDLMRVFNLRDPKALEELMTLVAAETSQRMEYSNLADSLSIKRDTVSKYLDHLEMVFLISREEFYSKSRKSRIKKSKKIYFCNVGLRNALTGVLSDSLLKDYQELGKVVETLVHEHSKRLKFCLEPGIEPQLYYWKTNTGEEVDIVLEVKKKPIPIEVKYRDDVPDNILKGFNAFLKSKKKCPFGIVVTRNVLKRREDFVIIPLWLFLLMC